MQGREEKRKGQVPEVLVGRSIMYTHSFAHFSMSNTSDHNAGIHYLSSIRPEALVRLSFIGTIRTVDLLVYERKDEETEREREGGGGGRVERKREREKGEKTNNSYKKRRTIACDPRITR